MDDMNKIFELADKMLKANLNVMILKGCKDEKVKKLILLLNEYGIYGIDAVSFLQKLALCINTDGDKND